MNRRFGCRARTDFRVIMREGRFTSQCRGIELSPSGIIVERGRELSGADDRIIVDLTLCLPERFYRVQTLARPVWGFGSQQALKFLTISEVDRLTLAEHLDLMRLRGAALS